MTTQLFETSTPTILKPSRLLASLAMVAVGATAMATIASCALPQHSNPGDGFDETGDDDKAALPTIAVCPASDDERGAAISELALAGDTLSLTAIYSGGCETAAFDLCWDGNFFETMPVGVSLRLVNRGPVDSCRNMISTSLAFDASTLASAYLAAYGEAAGTINLRVGDNDTIAYAFDDALASEFARIAADAIVTSEADDSPRYFSLPFGKRITQRNVRKAFANAGLLGDDQAIEFWTRAETVAYFFDQEPPYEGEDDPNATAWRNIKQFFADHTSRSSLRAVRIGPAEEDGSLGDSEGEYFIYVFGKTPAGKLIGFVVTVVWT